VTDEDSKDSGWNWVIGFFCSRTCTLAIVDGYRVARFKNYLTS